MPGPDSYDPEWGTSSNAAKIDEALSDLYDRLSDCLGFRVPKHVVDIVREDLTYPIPATLTEGEWRLLRFAVERARDSL